MKKILLCILAVVLILLMSCSIFSGDGLSGLGKKIGIITTDEPPGVGEKAELGYNTCAPIIAALDEYHTRNNEYPGTLEELIPDYLTEIPSEVHQQPIAYTKNGESYYLSFYYIGPGMNACTYTPENDWDCSGAY